MFYTMSNNTVNDFFQDLDNLFNSSGYSKFRNSYKPYTTEKTDNGVSLVMEVPGYNKNLIDVTVEGKTLVVEGKSNSGDTDGFTEKFNMGDKFDGSGVNATIIDGVLTVSIPYVESVKPRKVKVKVG